MAANDVDVAMGLAVAALEAGDYATAKLKARVALGRLSVLANVRKGSSGFQLEWDRKSILGFLDEVKAAEVEAGAVTSVARGLQRTKVTYVEATD